MKRSIAILILLLLCSFTKAQWVQSNSPVGGDVLCLTAGPNGSGGTNLYAGVYNSGVFLSTDYGLNWKAVNSNLTDYLVLGICISDTNLFAGTRSGVFRSTNNGINWSNVLPITGDNGFLSFAVLGTYIFAGDINGDIYRSSDNGTNWSLVRTSSANYRNVYKINVIGTELIADCFEGWFISTDYGSTWATFNTNFTNSAVYSIATDGINIYAAGYEGLFISTDNGASWTNSGLTSISFIVANGTNLFAGYGGGIFHSSNKGASWTDVTAGLASVNFSSIVTSGSYVFVASQGGGVAVSSNNGTIWNNTGMKKLSINCITSSGTNLLAGTSENGIYLSTNNGSEWTTVGTGIKSVCGFTTIGTDVYAANTLQLLRSTNNGSSWTILNTGLPYSHFLAFGGDGNNLYIQTFFDKQYQPVPSLARSTDSGATWSNRLSDPDLAIVAFAFNGINAFAADIFKGVYRSTDKGLNWSNPNNGLTNTNVQAVAVKDGNVFAGTYGSGVFISTDNGSNWTEVNNGLSNKFAQSLIVIGGNIFAGTPEGVFRSSDNGTSWTNVGEGLSNADVISFYADETFLYAGIKGGYYGITSGGGLWKRPLVEITSVKESHQIPLSFSLQQNYPNPFNPSTTINYSLPKAGNVKLAVYNAIGSKVATLVNEYKPAGNYSVHFNASTLASGIYFYRLESGTYSAAKKFIVIK